MREWIEGPQRDFQAAILAGQLPEVARISQLLSKAAQEWQQIIEKQAPRDAVCSGEHGEVIRVRCGMTGVRVGKAVTRVQDKRVVDVDGSTLRTTVIPILMLGTHVKDA